MSTKEGRPELNHVTHLLVALAIDLRLARGRRSLLLHLHRRRRGGGCGHRRRRRRR